MNILEYFNEEDGLKIVWSHATNSHEDLEEALKTVMMVEADITLRWAGLPNQTDEVIMAHPPDVDSDLTFEEFIDAIMETKDKGMKCDFKLLDAVPLALQLLNEKSANLQNPVWLNADVITGPGGGTPINSKEFLSYVNKYFPLVTLSLGWTTTYPSSGYTQEHIQEMLTITKDLTQPVTLPVRCALLKQSWDLFRQFLQNETERYTLTVWTPKDANDWEGATPYDMLYSRNDLPKSKIYYDLPGQKFTDFTKLAVTAGTPLNHFPVSWDGFQITWKNDVNTRRDLETAIQNADLMMLQCDVSLSTTGIDLVMGNNGTSQVTFHDYLQLLVTSIKGIKIHIHGNNAVIPTVQKLLEFRDKVKQPVWLHADMFEGPNKPEDVTVVNSHLFMEEVKREFPYSTVSIGWASSYNIESSNTYTQAMINEAKLLAEQFSDLPVTFAVHAGMAKESWMLWQDLLTLSRAYTITLWASESDNIKSDDLRYIYDNSEPGKIFYECKNKIK